MHARAIVLPNANGVLTFGGDACARHIRHLTDFEQRQTVAGFQITCFAIKCDTEFENWSFIFSQRIADESDLYHVRFGFR